MSSGFYNCLFLPLLIVEIDRRGVEKTTIRWKDTVTSGVPDAPGKTAALYAPDGVLWGTVSEEVRDTPGEIYDYFVSLFIMTPRMSPIVVLGGRSM